MNYPPTSITRNHESKVLVAFKILFAFLGIWFGTYVFVSTFFNVWWLIFATLITLRSYIYLSRQSLKAPSYLALVVGIITGLAGR